MPTYQTPIQFSNTWRVPHFSANELCQVSGIRPGALRKYIGCHIFFTESQHKTTKGKARGFSLGDLCQARAMGKLMEVFEMSADRARHMAWGFTAAMHELALAYFQEGVPDPTLLAVCWPAPTRDAYGDQILGAELQDLMDGGSMYNPEFCGLIITRTKLWETIVGPCLEFAQSKLEARRDDAQTNPST